MVLKLLEDFLKNNEFIIEKVIQKKNNNLHVKRKDYVA